MFGFFKREKKLRLTFYMKSGNSFVIDNVAYFETVGGDTIEGLTIRHYKSASVKIDMTSLDLNQIEGITKEDY